MHWTEITERRSGDVVIFDLHGQMTLSGEESPRVLVEVRRVVREGCRKVLLNLTHVSYVDSTGIGEIAGAYTRVVREGGRVTHSKQNCPKVLGALRRCTGTAAADAVRPPGRFGVDGLRG